MSKTVEKYGIAAMRPYHAELARRVVLGASNIQLCEEFNLSLPRLSVVIHSPLFKLELDRVQKLRDQGVVEVTKTLQEISPLALDILERTMYHTKSEKNRIKIAETILDRAGYGAVQKSVVDLTSRNEQGYSNLTIEEKKRLAIERLERMREDAAKKEEEHKSAEAVTVEFEELPSMQEENKDDYSRSERSVEELSRRFVGCD